MILAKIHGIAAPRGNIQSIAVDIRQQPPLDSVFGSQSSVHPFASITLGDHKASHNHEFADVTLALIIPGLPRQRPSLLMHAYCIAASPIPPLQYKVALPLLFPDLASVPTAELVNHVCRRSRLVEKPMSQKADGWWYLGPPIVVMNVHFGRDFTNSCGDEVRPWESRFLRGVTEVSNEFEKSYRHSG